MTNDEAIKLLKMSDQAIWLKGLEKEQNEAIEMAIKSLEAWEGVKKEMQEQYRAFANIPSISDTWTDAIEIVDKHLKEEEK